LSWVWEGRLVIENIKYRSEEYHWKANVGNKLMILIKIRVCVLFEMLVIFHLVTNMGIYLKKIVKYIRKVAPLLWSPKAHYNVHKNPPMEPVLSQINPVNTPIFYLIRYKFHINILSPYFPRHPK
jgi:hypothetical protein